MPETRPNRPSSYAFLFHDDFAYIWPMAAFLAITQVGITWPATFAVGYAIKTLIAAALLIFLWPNYTRINWNYCWLGALLGVVGLAQWIGMGHLMVGHAPAWLKPEMKAFNPLEQIPSHTAAIAFLGCRIVDASLVVPVMEELFWRDYLWRTVVAPNNFKLATVGEWDWKAWLIVAAAFSSVHGQLWPLALVWGLLIGSLLAMTRSLGACIIMHGVTNLLLAVYVICTGEWFLL